MAGLVLERFDDASQDADAPPPPSFEDGFAAGVAAGRAEIEDAQQLLRAELVEAVRAIDTAQSAAEARVLVALHPLFSAIIDQLLPLVAQDVIGQQVVEVMMSHARSAAETAETLRISAHDQASILDALQASEQSATVLEDPALGPGQVILGQGETAEFIDFTEVVTAIQSALAALSTPDLGDQQDG